MRTLKTMLAAALVLAGVAQASAAPVILGEYYEETVTSSLFTPVPTDKMLIVKNFSCQITATSTSAYVMYAGITISPALTRFVYFPVFSSSPLNFNASGDTNFLVYSGKQPAVSWAVANGGNVTIKCTIIGRLVPTNATTGFFE